MCIHLFSTINTNYLVPFRVMVQSLVDTKSPDTRIRWHVLEAGLGPDEKAGVESHSDGSNLEFIWHSPTLDGIADLPTRGRAVPKMYERLLVPDLLPDEMERFVYLDSDLLIMDCLDTLWDTELDGAIVGAVQDPVVPLVSSPMGLKRYRELELARESPFFNAGVYIVDMEAWRKSCIGRRALEYLSRYRASVNLMDQDALNAVIGGRWKPLDYRWNISSVVGRTHFHPRNIDARQLERAAANPGIIHFAGYLKPWIHPRLGSRWARRYMDTLYSVFPDHRLERTIKARCISFYDRRLRALLHPLERLLWQTMRGF